MGAKSRKALWILTGTVSIMAFVYTSLPAESGSSAVPQSLHQMKSSFASVVKKAAPAVVNIAVTQVIRVAAPDPLLQFFFGDMMPFGGKERRVEGAFGSGVIVDPTGIVLTNYHVIRDAESVKVILNDRREFKATVMAKDPKADLAVLKIDPGSENLPYLEFANTGELEVGDLVLAIGNPFGVGQSVSNGIISALGRTIQQQGYGLFIQTDAPINPGNSGGGLIDSMGRLVGINTMIHSRSGGSHGVGFATPIDLAKPLIASVKEGKKVERPWLGLQVQTVTGDMANALGMDTPKGVLIVDLHPDSPGRNAGLRPKDLILSLNGQDVVSEEDFTFRIATFPVGGQATIVFKRDSMEKSTTLTLIAPPENPPKDMQNIRGRSILTGATVANLSPALETELGAILNRKGVVVIEIVRGSPAHALNLQPLDIILELNHRPVNAVGDIHVLLKAASVDETHIKILRNNKIIEGTVGY